MRCSTRRCPFQLILVEHLTGRYRHLTPATYNRYLATIRSLLTWCVENDLLPVPSTAGIRRRKQPTTVEVEHQSRPIDVDGLAALWSERRHPLRDWVFWAMAYDTAAQGREPVPT